MKKVLNTTQKLLSFLMILLSAFAVYKDNTDIAIYLVLAALYAESTADVTVTMLKEDEKENE